MNVYWLEQTQANLPSEDDWLGPSEALRLKAMHFPKRRADWLLGRWTAKCAVAACLGLSERMEELSRVEVRAAVSGEPEAYLEGLPLPLCISISHRAETALCLVGPAGAKLGCDLELVEERSEAFAEDYFSDDEKALLARSSPSHRDMLLSLLWSAKESVMKALHQGLRLPPRSIRITIAPIADCAESVEWSPLHARYGSDPALCGYWRKSGNLLRTVVAAAPSLFVFPITADVRAGNQTIRKEFSAA